MSYDYSENILVQKSAGDLLRDELGWDVQLVPSRFMRKIVCRLRQT